MPKIKQIIISVIVLVTSSQVVRSSESTNAEFQVNGKSVHVSVPFSGVSVTDSTAPLFRAFSKISGPDVKNVAVFLDDDSYETVKRGQFRGMEMYVTIGVQPSTIGRVGAGDLKVLKAGLRRKADSEDIPKLTGAAASSGVRVSAFDNYGVVRDDSNSIAMVSATKYANGDGNIVQETTVGTMFIVLHDSLVNVAVIKQEASDSAVQEVEKILASIRFNGAD